MKTKIQKSLTWIMYLLFILLLILILITNNAGKENFDKCIEHKCNWMSQKDCQKYREVSKCCQGASGKIGIVNNQPQCIFT
tara:strand:- start:930 stop:1172 length:243 start_codon:yes stop_codon:yes gene_type:complete